MWLGVIYHYLYNLIIKNINIKVQLIYLIIVISIISDENYNNREKIFIKNFRYKFYQSEYMR